MNFVIDGREIEALDGETVMQAARRHGIEIPHFCYHDKLSIAGSCRMCLVKVNNLPKLQPACNVPVAAKLVVDTQHEQVMQARKEVLQFTMVNHPVDCGICDKAGECTLQDNQMRFGAPQSIARDPKQHKRKLYDLSPRITLDNERCILCSRCVRFTREISGSNALGIVERGHHAFVDRIGTRPFDDPYSDNVIGICPTGALLSREFLYKSRVWFLEPVRSTCTGCARGCSINAWRRQKLREPKAPGIANPHAAWRITAFDNPEVNGPWLCNKGFDQHLLMARERHLQAHVAGRVAPLDTAVAAARTLLAGARRPAVLLSAHASNEELDAWRAAFGDRLAAYARQDVMPAPGEVVEDALLIRADKNPNSRGVHDRFGATPFDAAAGHDVVVVWGEFSGHATLGGAKVIHLTTFGAALPASVDVALPVSITFERTGTFTNFEGKTVVFDAVLDPPVGVLHAAEVFRRLAA
jgi:NADH-quinone oxidoreductase subunit G